MGPYVSENFKMLLLLQLLFFFNGPQSMQSEDKLDFNHNGQKGYMSHGCYHNQQTITVTIAITANFLYYYYIIFNILLLHGYVLQLQWLSFKPKYGNFDKACISETAAHRAKISSISTTTDRRGICARDVIMVITISKLLQLLLLLL